MNIDIDLELFNCENRGVHPMQFLNRVKEFNQFCQSNSEVQLLKIMKCFKGNSAVWAEVHNIDWVDYQSFERAFRGKYWSEEDLSLIHILPIFANILTVCSQGKEITIAI